MGGGGGVRGRGGKATDEVRVKMNYTVDRRPKGGMNLWVACVTEELRLLYARPKFGAESGSKLARATGAKGMECRLR